MAKKKLLIPKEKIIQKVKDAYARVYISYVDRVKGVKLEDLNTCLTDEKHIKGFSRFLEEVGDVVYVYWDDVQMYFDAQAGKQFTVNDIIDNIYENMLKNGAYTYEEWIKVTGLDQM